MNILLGAAIFFFTVLLTGPEAFAHFQMVLPSRDIVAEKDGKIVRLDLIFTHPMESGPVMAMGPPKRFGVIGTFGRKDLTPTLTRRNIEGRPAYTATFAVSTPSDHIFYLEPAPYWEPAEQKMIVHYTKTVVDVLGAEEGWDIMVGFPVEIEPLVRPYGLWSGNIFRGVVIKNGKPLPYAEVEVEYYNEGNKVRIPADPYVTQVIKADSRGVFSYAMPRAGWWGFAALAAGDQKMRSPDGTMVEVELGGLIWVRTRDMLGTNNKK